MCIRDRHQAKQYSNKATWSLGVTRPERAAILGLRNVVKATLALGPTPTLISGTLYVVKATLSSRVYLNAKSAHRSLAERRKGDLVVKGLFEGKERPSLACGRS